MGQVLWGFRSTTGILPHASSHGCHKKTSWRFRKQYSVFYGKGLFVSTHKGCRSFLAAPAQGELSQDSAPSETGQEGLQGRVRNEDVRHWQGRERGEEDVSSLPPTNSFSLGKQDQRRKKFHLLLAMPLWNFLGTFCWFWIRSWTCMDRTHTVWCVWVTH